MTFSLIPSETSILRKNITWIFILFLGIILKIALLPYIKEGDYKYFLEWINFIKNNGYYFSLKHNFYNYNPPYIYILIFLAKIGITPAFTIKIVSILFEYLMAYFIGKILVLKYQKNFFMLVSLAVIPLIPTVLLNSSYWVQCDSIYSAFVVGSVYFMMKEKPWFAALFLGFSFIFKMQAVMILPFFFVMLMRGKIKWFHFFAIPVVYFLSIVPAWIAGRALPDLLTIYFNQTSYFRELTMNFPNLYIWISNDYYDVATLAGIIFTSLFTLIFGIILGRKKQQFTFTIWIKLAFLSAILIPFILPGMHERYMYLGDVLGVLYLLIVRKNIHFPLGIILISTYSYLRCSRFIDLMPMEPAFFLYLVLIILVIIDFVKSFKEESPCKIN